MILPSKLYEFLKFLVKLIPLLVTFVGTVCLACGVAETKVNIILVIMGAVGTLIEGIVEACKATHWKIQAKDAVMSITDYDKELEDQDGAEAEDNDEPPAPFGYVGNGTLTTTIPKTEAEEPDPEEYIKTPPIEK